MGSASLSFDDEGILTPFLHRVPFSAPKHDCLREGKAQTDKEGTLMFFGNPDTVSIEIGEIDAQLDPPQIYIQIRFVLFGYRIGEWDDRVPITMAWRNMEDFLTCKNDRRDDSLSCVNSETFFERTFSAYYNHDWRKPPIVPNLRDRYHLSEIGGDSICDLFGIVVAEVAPNRSRIVVKDFRADQIILDGVVDSIDIERMGQEFVEWARHEYREKDGNGDILH